MDIPSLFMIPSAVSSGKVHSVFPNSTDADFDFNRDSDATRVNSEGLIERVGYYSAELVTNGDFATDSGWVKTNSTISQGTCNIMTTDGSFSGVYQNALESGKKYILQFDIVGVVSGELKVGVSNGGSEIASNLSSLGTNTFTFTSSGSSLSFARVSGVTDITIDNVSVKEITGDRARLNYEIEGGLVNTKPSLLLEPQSTNLIANSSFQSGWSILSGGTIVTNKVTSPDGSKNAAILKGDGINSNAPYIGMSVTSGTSYAFSVFVKPILATSFRLIGFSAQAGGSAKFDLSSGTVSVAADNDLSDAKIEDYGNGWFRCSVIATADGTGSALFGFESEFDINGDNFYIYGAQFEQQSYPTSYIPTNGSTQTRAAETCNGAGTSSIFESSEGILYAEISSLVGADNYRQITLSDGSTSNYVLLGFRNDTGNIYYQVAVSGVIQASFISSQSSINIFSKVAVKWKVNDFAIWVDGVKLSSDTSGNSFVANTLNVLNFDIIGVNDFYGKVRDIRVYNTKEMTDSEVDILLTKITS